MLRGQEAERRIVGDHMEGLRLEAGTGQDVAVPKIVDPQVHIHPNKRGDMVITVIEATTMATSGGLHQAVHKEAGCLLRPNLI
jgi:hypothetical protein